MDTYEKSGYLKENFQYFHLHTRKMQEFQYHYHDFHKVLFFLRGDVTYHIEGRMFRLLPGDVVLIPAGEIHKPVLNSAQIYERIILYLSPEFLTSAGKGKADLNRCFHQVNGHPANVMRILPAWQNALTSVCARLEEELAAPPLFAGQLRREYLAAELLILLNRASLNHCSIYPENTCKNEKITWILDYINSHLASPLSIDDLASRFFISRYHLMHLFKASTGYTIGNYISTKRLLYARSLIRSGISVTDACYASGFQNYSTFARAYKKQFQVSAKKYLSDCTFSVHK